MYIFYIGEMVSGCDHESDLAFPLLRAFSMFSTPLSESKTLPVSKGVIISFSEEEAALFIQKWYRGIKARMDMARYLCTIYTSDYDSAFGFDRFSFFFFFF